MCSLLSFLPFCALCSASHAPATLMSNAWRVSQVSANQQNLLNLQSTIVQRLAGYTPLTDARALLLTIRKGVTELPGFRAEAIIPRGCAGPLPALISHIIAQLSQPSARQQLVPETHLDGVRYPTAPENSRTWSIDIRSEDSTSASTRISIATLDRPQGLEPLRLDDKRWIYTWLANAGSNRSETGRRRTFLRSHEKEEAGNIRRSHSRCLSSMESRWPGE